MKGKLLLEGDGQRLIYPSSLIQTPRRSLVDTVPYSSGNETA